MTDGATACTGAGGEISLPIWERMFTCWMGRPFPITGMMSPSGLWIFVRDNPHQQIFEDELFTIRYFPEPAVDTSHSNDWIWWIR